MRPWHLDIPLTESISTGSAFGAKSLEREENEGVSLISPRDSFVNFVKQLFGGSLAGKSFLDCACNSGGYCFFAREMGAERCFGFDVRKHWIDQARFVQRNRTVAPVDRIEFREMDLVELAKLNLPPFDFVLFKGIFYHLAEPIAALKTVADLTRDVLWFNSATFDDDEGNSLYCTYESPNPVMSGVHVLSWLPTGPHVMGKILYWCGFRDIRMTFHKKELSPNEPRRGRIEIFAAREPGRLEGLRNAKILDPEKCIRW
jgi:2-polyprenyl-3-methyl-5-hydroxy-6-metoxy-1,4-benzoquinol methylase